MMDRFLSNPCRRLLEIGLGPGLFIPNLSKKCVNFFGMDIHDELGKIEIKMHEDNIVNCSLVRSDINQIPFQNETFDMIVCQSILEHLKDPDTAISEIFRVLRKDGKVIIGFPVKNRLTKFLFSLLGYDDNKIHPSGHNEILKSTSSKLKLEKMIFFPHIFGLENSLYFAGKFSKKDE